MARGAPPDEAEDAAQQVVLRALETDPEDERDRHSGYFRRGGRNQASNEARKRKGHVDIDRVVEWGLDGLVTDPREPPGAPSLEDSGGVLAMTARLPEPRRIVVRLTAIAGWSYREIGELLGKSADAVKMDYSRAKGQLREEFRRARIEGESPDV